MRRILHHRALLLVLVLWTAAAACATTSLGKAIQAADLQKQLVEATTVEFIKLHITGNITDATYAQGKAAYAKWATGQKALAESLAQWRLVSSADNTRKLEAALKAVAALADTYLQFVGQFVDINSIKARLAAAN